MTMHIGSALRVTAMSLLMALTGCGGSDAASNVGASTENADKAQDEKVDLRILTRAGGQYGFIAELAIDPEAQQQGLMGRTSLDDEAGMLFPFARPTMPSFWMKNTRIPLDLLFIRADGTIAAILQGEPESLQPLAANEPVIAVLEIASGRAEALGIAAGDHVAWGDCRGVETQPDAWRADRFCPSAAP